MVTLAFLASCRVGPRVHVTNPVPVRPITVRQDTIMERRADSAFANRSTQVLRTLPVNNWWEVFNDPILDSLERIAIDANWDLQTAAGRVEETRALLRVAYADLYPSLILNPSGTRQQLSINRPNPYASSSSTLPRTMINTFQFPFNVSYQVDLWGQFRNNIKAAKNNYLSSENDKKTLWLTITGNVAYNYFLVRITDLEIALFTNTIKNREESLEITRERYRVGLTTLLDVAQAETDLQTLQAQLYAYKTTRETALHTLAVQCGQSSVGFTIAPNGYIVMPPVIPANLTTDLINNRPDVRSKQLLAESAAAMIGYFESLKYPSLIFSGSAGSLSKNSETLLDYQSRTWTVGAGIAVPIFQGGRLDANTEAARARYKQAVTSYNSTIINALKEVEDALSYIRQGGQQAVIQEGIVKVSQQAADLSRERYTKGLITYFEVLNNQETALNAKNMAIQLVGQRLLYSVTLIEALGGGW